MYKSLISHIREEGRADSVSQLDTLLIVRVIRIVLSVYLPMLFMSLHGYYKVNYILYIVENLKLMN